MFFQTIAIVMIDVFLSYISVGYTYMKRNKEIPMGYSRQKGIDKQWQTPETTRTRQKQHKHKLKTNEQHGPHQ